MYPQTIFESKDYVTLTLPAIQSSTQNFSHGFSFRSLKRKWNQLPRLQRVLIGMVLGIIIAFLLIVLALPQPSEVLSTEESLETANPSRALEEVQLDKSVNDQNEKNLPTTASHSKKEERDKEEVQPNQQQDQIPAPIRRTERQEAVVNAMKHAWKGYKAYAWGHDHLQPISRSHNDWLHLGLTLIDALDTLWMMDLKDEFEEAKEWVEKELNFDRFRDVNLFETTIRVLGSLLSSYHASKEKVFLDKAIDLADRLLGAFSSQSGVPFSDVNLATGQPSKPKWGPDSSTSEVTTIQLEFRDLSKITGNPKYAEKVNYVMDHIHKLKKLDGLVPIFINAQTGQFRQHSTITLGARGDSYYEYLLKQWIQMGKTEKNLMDDYLEAVSGMEFHLAKRSHPSKLLFFAELHGASKSVVNKMDELTCFMPGTLALGVHNGMPGHHMDIAKELLNTCALTWLKQPTKLAPEITYFNVAEGNEEDFFVKNNDAHYLLRPETIESLWYLYHFTGNTTYQDWGWEMFQGIEKHCRVENGYTTIGNVKSATATKPRDRMESYFLSETLKYFFLLFSNDQRTYSLDKYVFNSEGHPLPIYN